MRCERNRVLRVRFALAQGRVAIYRGQLEFTQCEDERDREVHPKFRQTTDDDADAGAVLLGEFGHQEACPWFGEMVRAAREACAGPRACL